MGIKRQISILILIILVIIFFDLVLNEHYQKEKDQVDNIISELQEMVINNQDAKTKVQMLDKKWERFEKLAAFYTEHNELEKISLQISLVKKNIEIDDNTMTVEHLQEVKFWLNEILEKDELKLKNIF